MSEEQKRTGMKRAREPDEVERAREPNEVERQQLIQEAAQHQQQAEQHQQKAEQHRQQVEQHQQQAEQHRQQAEQHRQKHDQLFQQLLQLATHQRKELLEDLKKIVGNDRWTKAAAKVEGGEAVVGDSVGASVAAAVGASDYFKGIIMALQTDLTRQEATSDEQNMWKVFKERCNKFDKEKI